MISMESGVTELITSCNNTDNQTSIKNINSTSINNHIPSNNHMSDAIDKKTLPKNHIPSNHISTSKQC